MAKSGYDRIAKEYYSMEHKTSRNFDGATKNALSKMSISFKPGLILEVGAGRGRINEYLGVDLSTVVQLDNSKAMLELKKREKSLLRVFADACNIPCIDGQFSHVVGFLVDPFFGLQFLSESYRVLKKGGSILLTIPTKEWGKPLRKYLDIDLSVTRFKLINSESTVRLPSILHSKKRIKEMLELTKFSEISISSHSLADSDNTISDDIVRAAEDLDIDYRELPIINIIRAAK